MNAKKNDSSAVPDVYAQRVDSGDWESITEEVNEYGGALLPQLLTPEEAEEIRGLYDVDDAFRQTVNMGRVRFGEGQYKYFHTPYPEPIERLKQALYAQLLPIARDWWSKLGREAIWPDTLDEWLKMCHEAGQDKSTAILLTYGEKDWNALHRDLYGDLVFPLQVVINLNNPGVDHTGGEFLLLEQRPGRNPGARRSSCPRVTGMCSPRGIARWSPRAAGRRPPPVHTAGCARNSAGTGDRCGGRRAGRSCASPRCTERRDRTRPR